MTLDEFCDKVWEEVKEEVKISNMHALESWKAIFRLKKIKNGGKAQWRT